MIMEGVIVLSVVIAYELVQRVIERQQRRLIGEEPAATGTGSGRAGGGSGMKRKG